MGESKNKKTINVYFSIKRSDLNPLFANCDNSDNFEKTCPVFSMLKLVKASYEIEDAPSIAKRVKITGGKNQEIHFYTMMLMKYLCESCEHHTKLR